MDLSIRPSRRATLAKPASSATLTEPMPTHKRAMPLPCTGSLFMGLMTVIYLHILVASHFLYHTLIISRFGV